MTKTHACTRCGEDPGERHLCLADEESTWNCALCGVESRGFAFAFGLCPACGGALERRQGADDTMRAIALRQALQIELGGLAFYLDSASLTSDPELRALFEWLAELEAQHVRTLYWRFHLPPRAVRPGGLSLARLVVYGDESESPPADRKALLELAMALEQNAADFFAEERLQFDVGTLEWELYTEFEQEEREHIAMLKALKAKSD